MVSVGNFSAKKQSELLDYYINFLHVDGIIVIEPSEKIKNHTDIPIVQIGMGNESATVHCVDVDIKEALHASIEHLKKHGHEKIGFVGEKHTKQEYLYLKEALENSGVKNFEQYVEINDKRFGDCGYFGADALLSKEKLPTAIFAAYIHIAMGVMKRLAEAGLKIPEDISIVCMDDLSFMPYGNCELSCIRMHLDTLCLEAVELLYRSFENRYAKTKQVIKVTRTFKEGRTVGEVRLSNI